MSPIETLVPVSENAFPSLAALRSAHSDLLKRQQAGGGSPELLDAAETFVRRGRETGALLDSPDDRWSAQSALDYWASALYRLGRREIDSTLAEFDPALAPALDDALCPYVGLEAFREGQHELFFGRARLIGEMVSRLRESRLLAVLGPSGSGKSSLVLGGLLPELKAGALPGSEGWRLIPPLVPGSEPLRNLARALLPGDGDPATWLSPQAEKLERSPEHLARLLAQQGNTPAVLVVDQFEEVFTLCDDDRIRQAFIASLIYLLRLVAPVHRVVLTMRSDFESFIPRLRDLQPYFDERQVRVTPLSAAELREAIERPAERIGLKFEEGIVSALLEDLLGEPAGLPLLQFTLLKLWEGRKRNCVTWAAYRALGGGRLALANSADEFFKKLIPEDQETVRRILLRIVRPSEGRLDVTSSRIWRTDLLRGENPDQVGQVLDKLIAARLLRQTPGESPAEAQVEVAHEALVRNWPRLVRWLEEARTEITTRRRLEARAAEWIRLGCGPGGLLDAVQLVEAERWLASPEAEDLGSNQQLTALVAASRQAVERATRNRRWKTMALWGIPLFLALYTLIWAFIVLEVRRARVLKLTQAEVATLHKKQAEELEKHKAEIRQLVFLKTQADNQAQNARISADQSLKQAAAVITEATQKKQEAERERENAATAITSAKQVIRESKEQIELAQRDAAAKDREASAASAALLDVQSQQSSQLEKTKRELEELEEKKRQADERLKGMEKEVADGGGSHDETVPWLLKRTLKTMRKWIELAQFRNQLRPVQAGGSTSTEKGLSGSICCIVHDTKNTYLLSRTSVFDGVPGTLVLQPSLSEGPLGVRRNVVATLVRKGADGNRSGAIARLRGVGADPAILKLGKIEGIGERPEIGVGTLVQMAGAGSGIQTGKILRFDDDGRTIVTNFKPVPGDSGAPIVTMGHKIIGMLWGWSGRGGESYVAPIRQVLDELNVELGPRPPGQ